MTPTDLIGTRRTSFIRSHRNSAIQVREFVRNGPILDTAQHYPETLWLASDNHEVCTPDLAKTCQQERRTVRSRQCLTWHF